LPFPPGRGETLEMWMREGENGNKILEKEGNAIVVEENGKEGK